MHRVLMPLVVLGLLFGVLVGCGGDDGAGDVTPSVTTTPASSTTTEATTTTARATTAVPTTTARATTAVPTTTARATTAVPTTTTTVVREQVPVLSEDPPYGLAGIELPKTGDELVAVLERMPVIDGHQPTVTREGDLVTVAYEGTGLPVDYPSIWVMLDLEVDSEWFIDGLRQGIEDAEEEGTIVEASDLDPSDGLVWVAESKTEGGTTIFGMTWADPSDLGPSYSFVGDTVDFRIELIHAFIRAVGD